MIAQRQPPRWNVDAYLEMERQSPFRHELLDGYVYAMAASTVRHSRISVNLTNLFNAQLRETPCRAYNSDMKVRIDAQRYVYPDASLSCGQADLENEDAAFIGAPCLVAEVLTDDSTADYDRHDKFDRLYSTLESLREYILVETTQPGVEVRHRRPDSSWVIDQYGLDDWCVLENIGARFPVTELYE